MIRSLQLLFAASILATAAATWLGVDGLYRTRMSSRDSEIRQLIAQRDEYRGKPDDCSLEQAKARIAALEAELLAVRREHEPRHLTDDQRRALVASLKLPPGKKYLTSIGIDPACEDCVDYAQEIKAAIESVEGWSVLGGGMIFSKDGFDVALIVTDPARMPPHGELLANALRAAALDFHIMKEPRIAAVAARLEIRKKAKVQ